MISPVVVIALAAIVVAVIAFTSVRVLAARRRDALREAALAAGFEFEPELPALVAELADMRTLSHGHAHELLNAWRGHRGNVAVVLADHRYVTGSGKNRSVHRRSLAVLRQPHLELPHVFMRPQVAVFDAIGALLGGKDIDFADDLEFSRAFVVQGEDEAAVRALLGPSARPQVLQLARELRLEGRGDTLLVERPRALPPMELTAFLDTALSLLGVLAAALPRRW
jgi:hypothetical protein